MKRRGARRGLWIYVSEPPQLSQSSHPWGAVANLIGNGRGCEVNRGKVRWAKVSADVWLGTGFVFPSSELKFRAISDKRFGEYRNLYCGTPRSLDRSFACIVHKAFSLYSTN